MNYNAKILCRKLYSSSLKDVAWLEDAQLGLLISHTFVCKFGWVDAIRREKIDRCTENSASSNPFTSFKFGEYNHLPSMVKLPFLSFANFNK